MLTTSEYALVTNILGIIWQIKKLVVYLPLLKIETMKNKIPMIIMLVFATGMMFKILYTSTNPEPELTTNNFPNTFDEAECYADSLFDVTEPTVGYAVVSDKFDYVYNRFNVFNPELDSSTVITFNEVCKHYGLDSTEEMLEWCTGQILLESGAKQYYETNHPKSGKLVESYSGAIGISQIMPATAFGNLKKYVTEKEANDMYAMGCTSFAHILDSTCTKSEGITMAREWLTNETNNIILWGYIMRRKLDKRPNILKVLVSYNAGTGGMIKFVNNGGQLSNHEYVKGIQTKLNYAEATF